MTPVISKQNDSHLWSRLKPSHSTLLRHKRSTDLTEDSSQEDLPPLFQDVSFYL